MYLTFRFSCRDLFWRHCNAKTHIPNHNYNETVEDYFRDMNMWTTDLQWWKIGHDCVLEHTYSVFFFYC